MPSSVIRDWTYDAARRRLTIRFMSGDVYAYADVPPMAAEGLAVAPSKGRFIAERIRERFAFDRVHIEVP